MLAGVISAVIFVMAVIIVELSRRRPRYDALALVSRAEKMRVKKSFSGEFPEGRRILPEGNTFYLIRCVHNIVICRDGRTGQVFFIREFDLVESIQEDRIERAGHG